MTESTPAQPGWQFWIDRGGTFTDVVARTPAGDLRVRKLLSQAPEHYQDAAVQGIRDLIGTPSGRLPTQLIDSVRMGTTVATNALLERQGDPTVLVTTRGFKDALRIAYQNRPRLFDLAIELPELLYDRVIEVDERVTADGTVLATPDLEQLEIQLREVRRDGITGAAIVFMHAYRFPDHERQVAHCARAAGLSQVSTSHEASALIKFVGRGDTAVVDAYLSPILRRYVDQISRELGGVEVLFMQSNGGLTSARSFRGKDAVLSGPAGGIVGAVTTASQVGENKIITFDMGGTSTDVAHYSGDLERSFETEVAGVRMRAPMLAIHTVAAGGGSICHFDGARLRVGPDSAGSIPGPAAYGLGGPLTVTDCNVMLGRLQPEFFPHKFGPDRAQPIDTDAVHRGFEQLTRQIEKATGEWRSAEAVAEGFIEVAVANMANAIKKISVQKGHDPSGYTLCSFGGAGGQHACDVADSLGMESVVIHPLAGVLSAYGMGLADLRAMSERTVELELDAFLASDPDEGFAPLLHEVVSSLKRQGAPADAIRTLRQVHVKYAGTDTPLVIALTGQSQLRDDFNTAYQHQFGYTMPDREVVVDAIVVEAVYSPPSDATTVTLTDRRPREATAPLPKREVTTHLRGKPKLTPIFLRSELAAGDKILGPAIITDEFGTTFVAAGWQAANDSEGTLALRRVAARPHSRAIGTSVDPVMLELFNNLFMSVAEQMGFALQNSAHSVNIKERLDFSCAIFDADGGLVANAPHIPVHLGSMSECVRAVIRERRDTMLPGDVYAINAPFRGGTHLPDVTVITPVFNTQAANSTQALFYVASRGHHADIGGKTPGSMPPDSRSLAEEGVVIDNLRLVRADVLQESELRDVLASGAFPARNPDRNIADFAAQIAANHKGVVELDTMISEFGLDTVAAYMNHVQANAEEHVRKVIDRLAGGEFTTILDNGARISVAIRVDRERRTAVVDFTGSSPQLQNNFNAPTAISRAAVLYVFRCLVADDIPLNDGCLIPIDIILPSDSMLSPSADAAVVAGNVETSQAITDALFGALGVMASAQDTMNNLTFGNEQFQYYETICGGTGAGATFAGTSAVQSHMTNSRLTDPEVLELRFPVIVEDFSIRRGSGGAGRNCGGDGVIRRLRFTEPMDFAILSNRRTTSPFGLLGGEPGKPGRNWIERSDGTIENLKSADGGLANSGDAIVIQTPGGGGFGTDHG